MRAIGDVVRVLGLNDGTPWERAVCKIVALPTEGHENEYLILADYPLNHRRIQGVQRWIPGTLLRTEEG